MKVGTKVKLISVEELLKEGYLERGSNDTYSYKHPETGLGYTESMVYLSKEIKEAFIIEEVCTTSDYIIFEGFYWDKSWLEEVEDEKSSGKIQTISIEWT